jgi:hypothetical protein
MHPYALPNCGLKTYKLLWATHECLQDSVSSVPGGYTERIAKSGSISCSKVDLLLFKTVYILPSLICFYKVTEYNQLSHMCSHFPTATTVHTIVLLMHHICMNCKVGMLFLCNKTFIGVSSFDF